MDNFQCFLVVCCAFIGIGSALECYTCRDQDGNKDKCIKTTKQCEQHQDACTTLINWGIPPYWTPRGDRIHFISKDCDTRSGCDRRKIAVQSRCKRDWYLDWNCVDCCTGDLCNYYVTLGAGSIRANTVLATSLALFLYLWRLL